MGDANDKLRRILRAAGEVLAETLWPTRCVLCERPGAVLCENCMRNLPYLDQWRACPRCGATFGAVQCTSCDAVSMAKLGRSELPFDGCAAATMFDDATGRVVRVYKDHGEQRLARPMAECMVRALPPAWRFDAVTFIPATLSAVRSRGFDHARLLAERFAGMLGESLAFAGVPAAAPAPMPPASAAPSAFVISPAAAPPAQAAASAAQPAPVALLASAIPSAAVASAAFAAPPAFAAASAPAASPASAAPAPPLVGVFARPETYDQRKLSRGQRFSNTAGRFRADPAVCAGKSFLVIDDVSTTGATLFDASDALKAAGAACVYCMTFARGSG